MTSDAPALSVKIGTILLEPGRWARPKRATYAVSEWTGRFRHAGFDGMELWEDHDGDLLTSADFPTSVYNTYCGFDDASGPARAGALERIAAHRARGVKFNVGADEPCRVEYARNLREWVDALPEDCRPLCECHGGTIVETPEAAWDFFDQADVDCGVIVHAFADGEERLYEWLRRFGSLVELVHVQLRNDAGQFLRLDEAAELVERRLSILRDAAFAGSYTLEFTKGTGTTDDRPELLWEHALADLAFLRAHA